MWGVGSRGVHVVGCAGMPACLPASSVSGYKTCCIRHCELHQTEHRDHVIEAVSTYSYVPWAC